MVLAQLGTSISGALARMSKATVVDEKVLGECLNKITRALMRSDVRFETIRDMQTNIRKIVNLETLAAGTNKRRIIQQAVVSELCRMLDPGKPAFVPKKGKPSVVMFVGLQGQSAFSITVPPRICVLFKHKYSIMLFRILPPVVLNSGNLSPCTDIEL